MRTIEQSHLALVVRFFTLSNEDVQSSFLCGELSAKFIASHVLSLLDDPEMEDFGLHDQIVLVANLLLDVLDFLAWESWHNAINECGAHIIVFGEPLLETFIVGSKVVFPQFDVFVDAHLQVVSIQENQFARHDDETFRGVSIECLIAMEKQLHQLARIGRGRSIGEFARVIESDTGFGGVGDDESYFRLLGECHESRIL